MVQFRYQLPMKPITNFFKWYLIQTPKYLFILGKKITYIVNDQFAFTLNLRLIFTPLFGDYTGIGRFIGFVVRSIEIAIGILFVGFLYVVSFLVPLFWWLLPFILLDTKLGIYFSLPIIFGLYILNVFLKRNIPEKKTSYVEAKNILDCFRPTTLRLHKQLLKDCPKAMQKLLAIPSIQYILQKSELNSTDFQTKLATCPLIKSQNIDTTAWEYAKKHNSRYIEIEHIFLAYISLINGLDTFLSSYNTTLKTIENTTEWVISYRESLAKLYFWQEDYHTPEITGVGRGMTGRVTPNLDQVSQDITNQVKKGYLEPIIGRETEIKEMANILSSSKVNLLIIGEPGSGKTSVVKGIAFKIVYGTDFKALQFKRIVSLETGALIAGTKSAGDLAQKIKIIMDEVEASGDIILFIDEIHTLASTENNATDSSSVFSIIEPHLASGRIQFIGATNIANYRKYIEPNGSFSRLFQIYELPQASKADTLEILKKVAHDFERDNKVLITYPALEKAVDLSEKLIHERVLPDKAIDILSRTVAQVSATTKTVTGEDIAKQISEQTHVPVSSISADETRKLLNIETDMKKRVIGQDEAINQIGSAIKRSRVGIRNQNKPIASFLFVGTTGVGKTETAKALAKTYFGDVKTMIRLDMSEYQQIDAIDKLIGTPDGSRKGSLTEAVRTRPFSLILLDEIEKAHSNILLTFLQVLDDGRLTDTTGRVIDFTNSIIIATSNVGTKSIQKLSEGGGAFEEIKALVMNDVREHFAPEFLNRFTGIIVFKPLSIEGAKQIALLMLESVKTMCLEKSIKVSFTDELVTELVKRGYNPEWGARPLARVIEDSVETYIATKLLNGEFKSGQEVELGVEVFG